MGDLEEFGRLVKGLSDHDDRLRRECESRLMSLPARDIVKGLLEMVAGSSCHAQFGVKDRHMAAVILGATLVQKELFLVLDEAEQKDVKKRVLSDMIDAKEWQVQRALAHVIGLLGQMIDVSPTNCEWPELFATISNMICSKNVNHKILGMEIATYVSEEFTGAIGFEGLEGFAHAMKENMNPAISPFQLQIASVQLLGSMVPSVLGFERTPLVMLVPCIFNLLETAMIADKNSKNQNQSQEHLTNLLTSLIALFQGNSRIVKCQGGLEIVSSLMIIVNRQCVSTSARVAAMEALATLCEQCPSMMRNGYINNTETFPAVLIQSLFRILIHHCAEVQDLNSMANDQVKGGEDVEQAEQEEDMEEDENVTTAAWTLGRIASPYSLGPECVVPLSMQYAKECLEQPSWKPQFAGLEGIARIAEAIVTDEEESDTINQDEFVQQIGTWFTRSMLTGNGNQHFKVRFTAIQSLGTLCSVAPRRVREQCSESICISLLDCLSNSSPRIQSSAAQVLEIFFRDCHISYVQTYINRLLSTLGEIFQNGRHAVQISVLGSISSASQIVGIDSIASKIYIHWRPILCNIIEKAKNAMNFPFMRQLLQKAMECLAHLCVAVFTVRDTVNENNAKQDCWFLINLLNTEELLKSFATSSSSLNIDQGQGQNGWVVETWKLTSQCLGPEFLPQLEQILPKLVSIAAQEIEYDQEFVPVHTGFLDDKLEALSLIHNLISSLGTSFGAYIQGTSILAQKLFESDPEPQVKVICAGIISELICKNVHHYNSNQSHFQASMNALIAQLPVEKEDTSVDHAILIAIQEILRHTMQQGQRPDPQLVDHISSTLLARFKQSIHGRELLRAQLTLECGGNNESGDFGHDQDANEVYDQQEESEQEIRYVLVDTLSLFARLFGDIFAETFVAILLEPMMDLASPNRLVQDRSLAIYLIDQVLEHCYRGPKLSEFVVEILELLQANVADSVDPGSSEVLQGSAYGIALIAMNFPSSCCGKDVLSNVTFTLLQVVKRCSENQDDSFRQKLDPAIDNVAAAIGKFLRYASPASIAQLNHSQLLFECWLKRFPFDHDPQETQKSMDDLLYLFDRESCFPSPVLVLKAFCLYLINASRRESQENYERISQVLNHVREMKKDLDLWRELQTTLGPQQQHLLNLKLT